MTHFDKCAKCNKTILTNREYDICAVCMGFVTKSTEGNET